MTTMTEKAGHHPVVRGLPPSRPPRQSEGRSLTCPRCGERTTSVVDSRPTDGHDAIRRRRVCVCGHRMTTYERIETEPNRDITVEAVLMFASVQAALEKFSKSTGIGQAGDPSEDRS